MAHVETGLPLVPGQGFFSRLETAIKGAGNVIAALGTDYTPLIKFHEQQKTALDAADKAAWETGDQRLLNFNDSLRHHWAAKRLKATRDESTYVEAGAEHTFWSPKLFALNLMHQAGQLLPQI
jgi:hypothetical protein